MEICWKSPRSGPPFGARAFRKAVPLFVAEWAFRLGPLRRPWVVPLPCSRINLRKSGQSARAASRNSAPSTLALTQSECHSTEFSRRRRSCRSSPLGQPQMVPHTSLSSRHLDEDAPALVAEVAFGIVASRSALSSSDQPRKKAVSGKSAKGHDDGESHERWRWRCLHRRCGQPFHYAKFCPQSCVGAVDEVNVASSSAEGSDN